MRAFTPDYQLVTKATLKDVLLTLEAEPQKWKVFAGGTDLMVLFESGRLRHVNFLDLSPFKELRQIKADANELRFGALCTFTDLQSHSVIQAEFPLVVKSSRVTGAKAIQNRGTVGGNIANASPAADLPPSLLAYGAKIELLSSQGRRVIDYSQFHSGYKKTQLLPSEIISAVILPRQQIWTHHYYRKVGTRAFQAISKIALSGAAKMNQGVIESIHIGFASLAPTPLRAFSLEKSVVGQKASTLEMQRLAEDFVGTLSPVDDIRSTAIYRRRVTQRLVEHFLKVLGEPPGVYSET